MRLTENRAMTAKTVPLHEAETHLRELVELVELGQDVEITVDSGRRVRLISVPAPTKIRTFGQHRGKAKMSEDFDAPLPEGFWLTGEQ